jgi:hypothetical protein
MVRQCENAECKKFASFNVGGERSGRFCKQHCEVGMVNVKCKRCEYEDCNKQPTFNVDGVRLGRFCKQHSEAGMVMVTDKTCEYECCNKARYFNVEGERSGRFCKQHSEPGMVNVKKKLCEYDNCNKIPYFNMEGERSGRFCKQHSEPGMVDVKNKLCEYENCNKIPKFNVEGERLARFCKQHREVGMIDVKNKRCMTHLCSTLIGPRLRGYCLRCFIHTFPSDPLVRNHKTKECAVVDFVNECYPDKSWVFDKTIEGGCSKRRPDIVLDMGSEVLIIEVDEWQHRSYDCICEHKRTMQLFDDLGSRPIVLIRFNPDKYTTMSGTVVPSCWGITECTGICHVKTTQKNAWRDRLDTLRRSIDMVLVEGAAGKTVNDICLFYDEIPKSNV